MILNHLFGLYTSPREEWQTIDRTKETLAYPLRHIAHPRYMQLHRQCKDWLEYWCR